MMFLILLLIFAATVAALWFQGTWNNCVTLINMTLAMMIATNYYEPISTWIEGFDASFTYLLDFVVIWILFFVTYGFMRLFTDMLSGNRVKFIMPVEMALRSVTAIWAGWLMVCFVAFTLHFAPLNSVSPGGALASPTSPHSLSPYAAWHSFMHYRSVFALARGNFSGTPQPGGADVEAFDAQGDFFNKYQSRRSGYEQELMMRTAN